MRDEGGHLWAERCFTKSRGNLLDMAPSIDVRLEPIQ